MTTLKVTRNPNGFLVVTLRADPDGSCQRLHVWDEAGGDGDIHQHRACFTSRVIEGSMREEIYGYVDDAAGAHERLQADCWSEPSGEYHVDVESRTRCDVSLLRTEEHGPGDVYHRDARDLHRAVAATVPLVTLVWFGPVTQRVHSLIRPYAPGDVA